MTNTAAIVYLSTLIQQTTQHLHDSSIISSTDIVVEEEEVTEKSRMRLQEMIETCANHRYLEDLCVLSSATTTSIILQQLQQDVLVITQNVTLLQKFQSYAQRTARYLIEEIVEQSDVHNVEQDVLQLTMKEKQNLSYLSLATLQQEVNNNQRGILILKLLDYVEEIFMFLSSSTSSSSSSSSSYRAQVSTVFCSIIQCV